VFFQADYDKMGLQKDRLLRYFSDVIAITSPKNVTQSKFLATTVSTTKTYEEFNCVLGFVSVKSKFEIMLF